jgi:uncharacterized membrane protein YhdT
MESRTTKTLFSYAILMLIPGLFSVFYNPEHVLGWNAQGKTGLIACGVGAVLAAVFGFCSKQGMKWALWAGLLLTFLFIAQCGASSFKAARAMSGGDAKAWFKMTINLIAFLFSLRAFLTLGLIARQQPQS